MVTRDEAEGIAARVQIAFPDLTCFVEEDMEGDYYVFVISDRGEGPNLNTSIPSDWIALPWSNPDQRADVTSITKRV